MSDPDDERVYSIADLDALVPHILVAKAWIAAIEGELQKCLETGMVLENARLVPKRSNRAWTLPDGEELFIHLAEVLSAKKGRPGAVGFDEIAPRKPLSPSAMEKLVGKAFFGRSALATFVERSPSTGFNLQLGPMTENTED